MEIRIISDVMAVIRKSPGMYVPVDARPLSDRLLSMLLQDIISLGVQEFVVKRAGAWTFVASDTDWLHLGKFRPSSAEELFRRVEALPEAGQNSVRHEGVVRALADKVFLFGPEGSKYLSPFDTEKPSAEIATVCNNLGKKRIVGFEVEAKNEHKYGQHEGHKNP